MKLREVAGAINRCSSVSIWCPLAPGYGNYVTTTKTHARDLLNTLRSDNVHEIEAKVDEDELLDRRRPHQRNSRRSGACAGEGRGRMIQSKDFIAGIGFALAGMQRLFRQDSVVKEFCRDAGLDLKKFEQAGVSNYDLMVLERSLRKPETVHEAREKRKKAQ